MRLRERAGTQAASYQTGGANAATASGQRDSKRKSQERARIKDVQRAWTRISTRSTSGADEFRLIVSACCVLGTSLLYDPQKKSCQMFLSSELLLFNAKNWLKYGGANILRLPSIMCGDPRQSERSRRIYKNCSFDLASRNWACNRFVFVHCS